MGAIISFPERRRSQRTRRLDDNAVGANVIILPVIRIERQAEPHVPPLATSRKTSSTAPGRPRSPSGGRRRRRALPT